MATQDTINSAVTALLAIVTPAAGSPLATLVAQRATLLQQLQSLDTQILAAKTPDQLQAETTLRQIRQMANRTGTVIPGLNAPAGATGATGAS